MRDRRATAVGAVAPALVAFVALVCVDHGSLASLPETFAAAFLAVPMGMLLPSPGRGVVLLVCAVAVCLGLWVVRAVVPSPEDATVSTIATLAFAAGAVVVGVRDLAGRPPALHSARPTARPAAEASCRLARCTSCERTLCLTYNRDLVT